MTVWGERSRDVESVDEFFVGLGRGDVGEQVEAGYHEGGPRLALLRCLLEASQGRLNAHEAAYKLGCSTRTLRRYLRHLGTTFQAEAQAARRVRRAF